MSNIEIIAKRIKELEELAGLTPINKNFTVQARLTEARHILALLKASKS